MQPSKLLVLGLVLLSTSVFAKTSSTKSKKPAAISVEDAVDSLHEQVDGTAGTLHLNLTNTSCSWDKHNPSGTYRCDYTNTLGDQKKISGEKAAKLAVAITKKMTAKPDCSSMDRCGFPHEQDVKCTSTAEANGKWSCDVTSTPTARTAPAPQNSKKKDDPGAK